MSNIFITADSHLGHNNIREYCNRPFKCVEEMDEVIIERWNSVVKSYDTVYHLGDFSFKGGQYNYAKCLNGYIHLIKGNHDKRVDRDTFQTVSDYKEIKMGDIDICMMHYPLRTWNKRRYGAWMLHGHCHGTLPVTPNEYLLDVGVDTHGFYPWSFDDLKTKMSAVNWVPYNSSESER